MKGWEDTWAMLESGYNLQSPEVIKLLFHKEGEDKISHIKPTIWVALESKSPPAPGYSAMFWGPIQTSQSLTE